MMYGVSGYGLGEPKVYGGYGMDATAEQEPYKPKPKAEKGTAPAIGEKMPWEHSRYAKCYCKETGEHFKSLADAASKLGIDYNKLRNRLRRAYGRNECEVEEGGYTIVREGRE